MTTDSAAGFLGPPSASDAVERLYAEDLEEMGFVMNLSRVWAHQPEVHDRFSALVRDTAAAAGLTFRERGVLVAACAATRRDAYCALAWGGRLAAAAAAAGADAVLRGEDDGLDPRERALAGWARRVTSDPGGTGPDDVAALRDPGFDDAAVFALTLYVALRMVFSTVNAALGARPDGELLRTAPGPVRAAVTFGRPPAD